MRERENGREQGRLTMVLKWERSKSAVFLAHSAVRSIHAHTPIKPTNKQKSGLYHWHFHRPDRLMEKIQVYGKGWASRNQKRYKPSTLSHVHPPPTHTLLILHSKVILPPLTEPPLTLTSFIYPDFAVGDKNSESDRGGEVESTSWLLPIHANKP